MAVTRNDINRLKDEADIAAVVSYLQLEVKKKGNAYFITCPNPEHNDTHPTNCYYKDGWNHVYCWVCGNITNAVNLIMLVNHVSYGEACDILWEISGCPDWYYEKKQKGKKKRFVLSREDAELIGLRNPSRIKTPIAISDYKEELATSEEYEADEINYYLKLAVKRVNYLDFLSEEEYLTLILDKAKEKAYELQRKMQFLQLMKQALMKQGVRDPLTQSMLHLLCEQRRNCFALAKRVNKYIKAA